MVAEDREALTQDNRFSRQDARSFSSETQDTDFQGYSSLSLGTGRRLGMNRFLRVVAAGPDRLTEELATALAARTWFEFKPLFLLVHAGLQQRGAAHGGEEMLRLRAYDKLQGLVQRGIVEKEGKLYRGRLKKLAELADHTSAQHCENLMDVVRRGK